MHFAELNGTPKNNRTQCGFFGEFSTGRVHNLFVKDNVVPETIEGKKRGAPKKANAMTGRIGMRCPEDLVAWLESEGAYRGLGIGDIARMILMEAMHKSQRDEERMNGD